MNTLPLSLGITRQRQLHLDSLLMVTYKEMQPPDKRLQYRYTKFVYML